MLTFVHQAFVYFDKIIRFEFYMDSNLSGKTEPK